jgi:hypothetical protein
MTSDDYAYTPSAAYALLSDKLATSNPADTLTSLANAAERLTRDVRRSREKIERGLLRAWNGPFAQLELLITLGIDFATAWRLRLEASGAEPDSRFTAATALHVRASSTASEVLRLLRAGLPNAALARWRTLYEQATTAAFLATEDQRFSDRYLLAETVEYAAYLEKRLEFLGDDATEEDHTRTRDAIRARETALQEHPDLTSARAWQRDLERGIKATSFADLQRRLGLDAYAEVHYLLANVETHSSHLAYTLGLGRIGGINGHVVGPTFLDLEQAGAAVPPQLALLTYTLLVLWHDDRGATEAEILNGLAQTTATAFEMVGGELRRRDALIARAVRGEAVELPWLAMEAPTQPASSRRTPKRKRRK